MDRLSIASRALIRQNNLRFYQVSSVDFLRLAQQMRRFRDFLHLDVVYQLHMRALSFLRDDVDAKLFEFIVVALRWRIDNLSDYIGMAIAGRLVDTLPKRDDSSSFIYLVCLHWYKRAAETALVMLFVSRKGNKNRPYSFNQPWRILWCTYLHGIHGSDGRPVPMIANAALDANL